MDTTDASNYKLPVSSTSDRAFLEGLKRGLAQELEGLKQQMQGKRQLLNAVERQLNRPAEWQQLTD